MLYPNQDLIDKRKRILFLFVLLFKCYIHVEPFYHSNKEWCTSFLDMLEKEYYHDETALSSNTRRMDIFVKMMYEYKKTLDKDGYIITLYPPYDNITIGSYLDNLIELSKTIGRCAK